MTACDGPFHARVLAPADSPIVRVKASVQPATVHRVERGDPGPQGQQGIQGFQGPSGDYGYIRYVQSTAGGATALAPGVRTLVAMALDPAQTDDQLQSTFAGFGFYDGTTFRVRHAKDSLRVRFGLNAISIVAGGFLSLEAQIVGVGTLLDTQAKNLPSQAGAVQRLNYEIDLFSGAAFAANGMQFYLTATVPVMVQNETLKVTPDHAGA